LTLVTTVTLAITAGVALKLSPGRGATATPAPTLPAVTVAAPLARNVIEWNDYVGRFTASQAVEVRPRVSGQLTAIHFRDGEIVKKGQLLFTIDPRPFVAREAEARAEVTRAQSAIALAQADLRRAQGLKGDEAVAVGDLDQLRQRSQAGKAALEAAEARLRERALDVEFTQVRAPIDGQVSDRRVDIGSLVASEGSNPTLLTTINRLNPIYFVFDASEALFLKSKRDSQQGAAPATVQVRLQDESDYHWSGHLDFIDNGFNPGSGTIRQRATIDNPGYFLTPGLFGNMRVSTATTEKALLVPDSLVQADQARKIVLVVGSDGLVSAKAVTLGPLVGTLRIIKTGLSSTDRIVTEGVLAATPGTKVNARPGEITVDPSGATVSTMAPASSQATLAP
jgi:RND family efflux transporter MFP subunit